MFFWIGQILWANAVVSTAANVSTKIESTVIVTVILERVYYQQMHPKTLS
jgi:hypothetical protein